MEHSKQTRDERQQARFRDISGYPGASVSARSMPSVHLAISADDRGLITRPNDESMAPERVSRVGIVAGSLSVSSHSG